MAKINENDFKYKIGEWDYFFTNGDHVYRKTLPNNQEIIVAESGPSICTEKELEHSLKKALEK